MAPIIRVIHTQGLENPLPDKFRIGFSADLFNDGPQQNITGIVVQPPFSGLEIHGFLFEKIDQFFNGHVQSHVFFPEFSHSGVASNSRGMVQQVFDGDVVAMGGILIQIFVNRIADLQFPLFSQHHDCCRGKLLGDGANSENMFRRHSNPMFQVGHAVSPAQHHPVIHHSQYRNPRFPGLELPGQETVDFPGHPGPGHLGTMGCRSQKSGKQNKHQKKTGNQFTNRTPGIQFLINHTLSSSLVFVYLTKNP